MRGEFCEGGREKMKTLRIELTPEQQETMKSFYAVSRWDYDHDKKIFELTIQERAICSACGQEKPEWGEEEEC